MPTSRFAIRILVTNPAGETLVCGPRDIVTVLGDLYLELVAKRDITVRFDGDGSVWRYRFEGAHAA